MKKIGDWWFPDSEEQMRSEIEKKGSWHMHRLAAALEQLPRVGKSIDNLNTVIDAGAHVGTWSVAFAKCAKQVLSFEPTRDTYECLVKNLKDRNMYHEGHVVTWNVALAERDRFVVPMIDDRHGHGNSGGAWMRDVSALEKLPANAVPATSLDGYGFKNVDIIKIDVEGMEPFVIRGAKATITKHRPLIIYENKPIFGLRYGWNDKNGPRFLLQKMGATCLLDSHGKDEVWGFP